MITEFECPPGGPVIRFVPETGEKLAGCAMCKVCRGCGINGFVPELDFRGELNE